MIWIAALKRALATFSKRSIRAIADRNGVSPMDTANRQLKVSWSDAFMGYLDYLFTIASWRDRDSLDRLVLDLLVIVKEGRFNLLL